MTELSERIAAGIAILDEAVPGWKKEIDCETLDLSDCSMCVLGQVYGTYNEGLTVLTKRLIKPGMSYAKENDITNKFASDHGFDERAFNEDGEVIEGSYTFRDMTEAWEKEVCE